MGVMGAEDMVVVMVAATAVTVVATEGFTAATEMAVGGTGATAMGMVAGRSRRQRVCAAIDAVCGMNN
jgi:hypothetical protein